VTDDWFERRTHQWYDWSSDELLEIERQTRLTVSLVVAARNEAATVGDVVSRSREMLVETQSLVDEIVVIDSDSEDETFQVAANVGAAAFRAAEIRPDLGRAQGKGEAMWKSLFVTRGDVLVFMDADLKDWDTDFVPGLLGPLLTQSEVSLVKGFYERPLLGDAGSQAYEGGRVTELAARPLISLLFPVLSSIVQPLAGEWAVRRNHFASLAVPTGYAVELAALIDTLRDAGLDAIAQVDLGHRSHRHQSLRDLGGMAAQLLAAAWRRSETRELRDSFTLRQFVPQPRVQDVMVHVEERPPASNFLILEH
jgi:glucosyl-3-phosphoglycerate synthase